MHTKNDLFARQKRGLRRSNQPSFSKTMVRAFLWGSGALWLAACGSDKPASDSGASGRAVIPQAQDERAPLIAGDREETPKAGQPEVKVDEVAPKGTEATPVKAGVTALAQEIASLYRTWAGGEGTAQGYSSALQQALKAHKSPLQAYVSGVLAPQGQARTTPMLSSGGVLLPESEEVLGLLKAVADYGLKTELFPLSDIDSALEALKASGSAEAGELEEAEEALREFVFANRPQGEPDVSAIAEAALKAGLDDRDIDNLRPVKARIEKAIASQGKTQAALAQLDVAVVESVQRWVLEQRFIKRAHPFLADKSDEAALKRVDAEFQAFLAKVDWSQPSQIAQAMQEALPRYPDYEATRQHYLRYKALAEQFQPHLELSKEVERLKRGASGEHVKQLETRLIQEGYLKGEPTGKFGAELEQAVQAYQETHQMVVNGKLDKAMRSSLNRPFAERAKQLELSLMRYRESDVHQGRFRFGEQAPGSDKAKTPISEVRAVINIPSMEARFYRAGELARTHRVVVGNNSNDTEVRSGKRGKLNQTRLFTAEMQTVVLNPTWNVPRRIKEQELDRLLMDEPDYYEKHNFKVIINPDGTERVQQQAGPGNALGLVKFLFPNEFAIYMHDTPKKRLFERPVRAFSHGCMRTENPLDLARWILVEVDKELTDAQFDAVLASREEKHFAIRPRIAISTDYVTTTIDDQGRVHFLADIYGFDGFYFEGKVPLRNDKEMPMTVLF